MCKTSTIEFHAGYYEWNLYINGKLVYTFDEGISEWITNNTKKDDFMNIVEMFVDGMIEEMEKNRKQTHFRCQEQYRNHHQQNA